MTPGVIHVYATSGKAMVHVSLNWFNEEAEPTVMYDAPGFRFGQTKADIAVDWYGKGRVKLRGHCLLETGKSGVFELDIVHEWIPGKRGDIQTRHLWNAQDRFRLVVKEGDKSVYVKGGILTPVSRVFRHGAAHGDAVLVPPNDQ